MGSGDTSLAINCPGHDANHSPLSRAMLNKDLTKDIHPWLIVSCNVRHLSWYRYETQQHESCQDQHCTYLLFKTITVYCAYMELINILCGKIHFHVTIGNT